MSIFHVFFKPYSKEYLSHKRTYKQIIKERDQGTLNLINDFDTFIKDKFQNDSLNLVASKLLFDYKKHFEKSSLEIKKYNKKKKSLALSHSFRGRNSFRFWLAYFGIALGLLFFSAKSLYNDIVSGSTYKFHVVSLSGILIAFFWIIHFVFLTQKDFNTNKYFLILILCGIFSSIFTYFLVKYYAYKDDLILSQLSLIERIKTTHYPKIAVKARYYEKYGEPLIELDSVEDNINMFQNDINTSLNI